MIRILLAEDDEAMRTYLARALEQAGYGVDAVDRGTAALPLLETEEYDLLLSDIVMPEMDGIELAQRCAEISPNTRVMFITGFAAVTLKASREAPRAKDAVEAVPPQGPRARSRADVRGRNHRGVVPSLGPLVIAA
jgi:two-component system cell cycle response regulator CpdR